MTTDPGDLEQALIDAYRRQLAHYDRALAILQERDPRASSNAPAIESRDVSTEDLSTKIDDPPDSPLPRTRGRGVGGEGDKPACSPIPATPLSRSAGGEGSINQPTSRDADWAPEVHAALQQAWNIAQQLAETQAAWRQAGQPAGEELAALLGRLGERIKAISGRIDKQLAKFTSRKEEMKPEVDELIQKRRMLQAYGRTHPGQLAT